MNKLVLIDSSEPNERWGELLRFCVSNGIESAWLGPYDFRVGEFGPWDLLAELAQADIEFLLSRTDWIVSDRDLLKKHAAAMQVPYIAADKATMMEEVKAAWERTLH